MRENLTIRTYDDEHGAWHVELCVPGGQRSALVELDADMTRILTAVVMWIFNASELADRAARLVREPAEGASNAN